MNISRIRVLIGKELREFRANPSVFIPVLIVVAVSTLMPILVVVIIPRAIGQPLASDRGLQQAIARVTGGSGPLAALPPQAAAEAFFFQQFLFMFLMAAFVPALAIEAAGLCLYLAMVAALSSPGVLRVLLTGRTALLVGMLGPLASLAALQAAIAVSSRVNDPRSAQQIAVLLLMPLMVMFVGQIAGAFVVTNTILALVTAGIGVAWVLLLLLSVALFDRETILTRWK